MRHKWEKETNHPYCHKYVCVKCGCIKDATAMMNVVYWMNDEKFFATPDCAVQKPLNHATQKNSI